MAKKLRAPANGNSKDGKKKGKAAKPAPLLLGSAADDVVKDVYERALKAKLAAEKAVKDAEPYKAEIKSAEGVFRAVLKDGKKKGVDPDDILWRLAQRARSPEQIDKETQRRSRLAYLTGLPIGTQISMLGLMGDGKTTVATAIENDARAGEGDAGEAFEDGYDLGLAGKTVQSQTDYTEEHKHWLEFMRGYSKGQRELQSKPGAPTASAAATAH